MYKNEGCIIAITMDVPTRAYQELRDMMDKGMVLDVKCNLDGSITVSYMLQPTDDSEELSKRKRDIFPF